MTNIAILLVILGLLGLVFAIFPSYPICKRPKYQHKGWLLLLTLIGLFIVGYLAYLGMLLHRDISNLDIIISAIFCGGGLFVLLIATMSKKTIFTLQEMIEEKHHQANHDFLTGLPNRNQFYEFIDQLISDKGQIFSCLMMDLNSFKVINDTFGHSEGDHILQIVAQRINNVTPKYALAARLGGDELTMILPNATSKEAVKVARAIQKKLLEEILCENHSLTIGVSIGIAEYPKDGDDRQKIMRSADIAMYQAKKNTEHIALFEKEVCQTNLDFI